MKVERAFILEEKEIPLFEELTGAVVTKEMGVEKRRGKIKKTVLLLYGDELRGGKFEKIAPIDTPQRMESFRIESEGGHSHFILPGKYFGRHFIMWNGEEMEYYDTWMGRGGHMAPECWVYAVRFEKEKKEDGKKRKSKLFPSYQEALEYIMGPPISDS